MKSIFHFLFLEFIFLSAVRKNIEKFFKTVRLLMVGVIALHAVDQFVVPKGVDLGVKPAGAAEPKKAPPTALTEKMDISPKVLTRVSEFTEEDLFSFVLDYKTIKESRIIEAAKLENMGREAIKIAVEKYSFKFWRKFEKIPRELLTSEIIKIAAEKKSVRKFWRKFEKIPRELLTSEIIKIAASKESAYKFRRAGFWRKFEKIPRELLTSEIIEIAAKKHAREFVRNYKTIKELGIIEAAKLERMGREAVVGNL